MHYQRSAQDWLDNFDANRDEIERVLREVYGSETALWMRRWRWSSWPPRACLDTPVAANRA